MKIILLILLATFVRETSAQEFTVLLRKASSNGTYLESVSLEDLDGNASFDGKYLKVVKGRSHEAISFHEPDQDLLLKAATVYHHLTLARKFWTEKIGSDMPTKAGKIVVRLEITNLFDEQGHFANDNRDPQYNNGLSIPEGETPDWVPESKKDKWGKEIWLRPMKRIDVSDLIRQMDLRPFSSNLQALEGPFINYTQNTFQQNILERLFYPSYARHSFGTDVLIFAGTIAMTKAVIEASRLLDKFFLEKYFYLDTALVPEVLYHEYSHIMLSDSLKMSHSTPTIEGMADYFAAALSQKKKVYGRVKGHSNSNPKNTESKERYNHWKEANFNAQGDFVLSVLWDVREALGPDAADRVVFEARKRMETDSNIYSGLIRAILDSCSLNCSEPRSDKLKLYETFASRGF